MKEAYSAIRLESQQLRQPVSSDVQKKKPVSQWPTGFSFSLNERISSCPEIFAESTYLVEDFLQIAQNRRDVKFVCTASCVRCFDTE